MSHPFIIWTMQRTGGTSLADLLMEMSEHPRAEHEPFNRDRQFGAVTAAWSETHDEAALSEAMAGILKQRYLIKHTYELRDMALNAALLKAAAATPYRHVFLRRQDELSRLVSKYIAEANGTWFTDYAAKVYEKIRTGERRLGAIPVKQLVAAYHRCRQATEEVRELMAKLGVAFRDLAYEELYVGERESRLRVFDRLCKFLDFAPEVVELNRAAIDEKLFHGSQDTRSILSFLPNLDAVAAALVAEGYRPVAGSLGAAPQSGESPLEEAPLGGLGRIWRKLHAEADGKR
jgi:LPS sulfotransferase NodH